jgi:hypothetical protein
VAATPPTTSMPTASEASNSSKRLISRPFSRSSWEKVPGSSPRYTPFCSFLQRLYTSFHL